MQLDKTTQDLLSGKFTFQERHGMRIITRSGRSLRYVPPFAMNDAQLRQVVVAAAVSYIFRNKTVPKDFNPDFETLSGQAGEWMATVGAVAWRSWRLRWKASDVANSLAMEETSVHRILLKLRRQANIFGFELNDHWHTGRRARCTDEAILAAWAAGKAMSAIRKETGAGRERIRDLLKKNGVWVTRRDSREATV